MRSIFTLIFLIVSIAGFFEKAKKEQQDKQRQHPSRQYRNTAPVTSKNVQRKQTNRSGGGQKAGSPGEGQRVPSYMDGRMADRSITENMSHEGQSEGFYSQRSESAEREMQVSDSLLTADDEAATDFDISAEDLMRSIVMAEILGKPRAIRRSIR